MATLLGMLGCVLTSGCSADRPLSAEVLDFGIYDVRLTGKGTKVESTLSGSVLDIEGDAKLVNQEITIPAVTGTSFGFRFILKGDSNSTPPLITFEHTNPGITPPGRPKGTSDAFQCRCPVGEIQRCVYTINHDWEAEPGNWVLRILDGERLLAEKTFVLKKAL